MCALSFSESRCSGHGASGEVSAAVAGIVDERGAPSAPADGARIPSLVMTVLSAGRFVIPLPLLESALFIFTIPDPQPIAQGGYV